MSAHSALWRWVRRIGIAIALLAVLIGAGAWWLLGTTAGLRFALDRAVAASDGAITVQAAHGDLAGPLQLDGVTWRDADTGTRVQIDHLQADPALWSLLGGRVRLSSLAADGVDVDLHTQANAPPESAPSSPLQPPVNLVLDQAHIRDIHIRRDGASVFVANTLDVAGRWTADGLVVRQLALRAPDGQADLHGTLALGDKIRGTGHGSFRWTLNDTTWAGALEAHSNGTATTLALTLTDPMRATLDMTLQQTPQLTWTATLRAPPFDTRPLLGESSIQRLALALAGRGDRHGGTLTGTVDINQTRFVLQPLELHYDADAERVTVDRLVLTSPRIKGRLTGHGTLDLAAAPARADLALNWQDVVVPASLAGQSLASAGAITLTGSIDQYHVKGTMTLGPPGRPAQLALDLAGTPAQVTLNHLTIRQPKGMLDTHGTVTLKPQLAWDLVATGKAFNPGLLLAGWNGALDIDLATTGHATPAGPAATFKLAQLDGHLRERKLHGEGTLRVTPQRVLNGELALTSGHSRIRITAKGTRTNHVDVALAIASLNDWLPGASGALHGEIRIDGLWPKLAVDAHVRGQDLSMGARRIDTLELAAHVPDISHPGGTLSLKAGRVALGAFAFESVTVTGSGNGAHHTLALAAKGQPLSLHVALGGSMHGKAWTGTLSTLNVDLEGLPPWHLQGPARLAWNNGEARIGTLCLTAGTPTLCVAAERSRNGTLHASYRLVKVPLALVASVAGAGLPLTSTGVLNGAGEITHTSSGAWTGHATLASLEGSIAYADRPDLPLLAYTNFHAQATLAPQAQHVTLAAAFRDGGHLDGSLDVTGPSRALSGAITLRLDSLAPVALFTNALANIKGHVDAHFRLGGTLAQPEFDGQAAVEGLAAEVPALGLKLHDGKITVATTDTRGLAIDGHIRSGAGTLQLSGSFGPGADTPGEIDIRGKEVLVADIPAARVTLSPDIHITRSSELMAVTGAVSVDKARIELEKLPGAGATQASPDVVIVDAQRKSAENAALPIRADITVNLGQHTHLIGYGLDGYASGTLRVEQAPGKATVGHGQVVINGSFKAFGQALTIQQGRLLFAGTPIDNPGLDIRAVRVLHPNATISDNEVVGLQISGTARHPVMTVFSNPAMEQADALAYLVTGKPLAAVGSGEGDTVNAAAQALGSVAGNLLAKGIGKRLGIEAGVSSNAALGTAAFTVGKYLSPRLYLSYGVGLFEPGQVITLRYILSQHWNFEAEQATDFSRASFNYRLER